MLLCKFFIAKFPFLFYYFYRGINMEEKLTQSLETYLLAIDELLKNKEKIIVKDVAEYLNIGGASTSDAIKKLKEKGFVNYEPYGNITFTGKGVEAVSLKKYRHNTISKFLY